MSNDGTHSYYEWQVSTLMLAYDVAEPLSRDDDEALAQREQNVQQELHRMVHGVLPQEYLTNAQQDFPPEMVQILTRATIQRAMMIVTGE